MSFYYALLASAIVLWLVYRYVTYTRVRENGFSQPNEKGSASKQENPLRAYQDIEPLHDFDWESTPPMKLRPFKPKYHLTMGKIQSSLIMVFATDRLAFQSSSGNGLPL
jgi:hypothetical protein